VSGSLIKRLDELLRRLRVGGSRTIVLKVPTMLTPIEGSVENSSTVTPETEAAVDEILEEIGATDDDFIIQVARFYLETKTNGGSEPEPKPLPELISVT
jgi:hypothetical protein